LLFWFAVAVAAPTASRQLDGTNVPSGILYDLVTPMARVDRFDGSTSAPAADAATLRQAVFELSRASLEVQAWPDAAFRDDGLAWSVSGLSTRYGRCGPTLGDRVRRAEGNRLVPTRARQAGTRISCGPRSRISHHRCFHLS
jgi:hypothetical protein